MKKILFFILLSLSATAFSETWEIKSGNGNYVVSHTIKKVTGETKKVHGKIQCAESSCEFMIAVPVVSFESSDSNRDLNMQSLLEVHKYPYTTAKGTFPKGSFNLKEWKLPLEVEFHGIKRKYQAVIHQDQMHTLATFNLDLDAHKIERPSLFTVKIDNEVPVTFNLDWKIAGQ